jgi:hypothetical protein
MTIGADGLDLRIEPAPDSHGRLAVRVTFANRGSGRVCLLDCFEPLPVFFSFHLVRADGTPVGLPGGGKIAFGPDAPGYVGLEAGQTFSLDIDLAPLAPRDLEPGAYDVSAEYHNQYGRDCAQRTLQSNTVGLVVTGGRS